MDDKKKSKEVRGYTQVNRQDASNDLAQAKEYKGVRALEDLRKQIARKFPGINIQKREK